MVTIFINSLNYLILLLNGQSLISQNGKLFYIVRTAYFDLTLVCKSLLHTFCTPEIQPRLILISTYLDIGKEYFSSIIVVIG